MALYEHVFITRQDLSHAQAEALMEQFGNILETNGGSLVHQEYWGLKTLAFRINKNRKGHYGFFRSDAPAPAVVEMERQMRFHEDVLRVLTTRVDKHDEGPSIMMKFKSSGKGHSGHKN